VAELIIERNFPPLTPNEPPKKWYMYTLRFYHREAPRCLIVIQGIFIYTGNTWCRRPPLIEKAAPILTLNTALNHTTTLPQFILLPFPKGLYGNSSLEADGPSK
jgi:hypothetical protein